MNKQSIQQRIENAEAELQAAKEELKNLDKKPEKAFRLHGGGRVYEIAPAHWQVNEYTEQGNTFATREEAEREARHRKLTETYLTFLDELNEGWTADWSDHTQRKYSYLWDFSDDKITYTWSRYFCEHANIRYYTIKDFSGKLMHRFTPQELKFIFTGEEA